MTTHPAHPTATQNSLCLLSDSRSTKPNHDFRFLLQNGTDMPTVLRKTDPRLMKWDYLSHLDFEAPLQSQSLTDQ